jgi:hypothetical protein
MRSVWIPFPQPALWYPCRIQTYCLSKLYHTQQTTRANGSVGNVLRGALWCVMRKKQIIRLQSKVLVLNNRLTEVWSSVTKEIVRFFPLEITKIMWTNTEDCWTRMHSQHHINLLRGQSQLTLCFTKALWVFWHPIGYTVINIWLTWSWEPPRSNKSLTSNF